MAQVIAPDVTGGLMRGMAAGQQMKQQSDIMQTDAIMKSAFQKGGSMPAVYERASEALGRAGLADQAFKAHEASQQMLLQGMQLTHAKVSNAIDGMKLQQLKLETVASYLEGTPNQAAWNNFNLQYQKMFGMPSPYANTPFSPEAWNHARMLGLSAKDRMTLEMKQLQDYMTQVYRQERLNADQQHYQDIKNHFDEVDALREKEINMMKQKMNNAKRMSPSNTEVGNVDSLFGNSEIGKQLDVGAKPSTSGVMVHTPQYNQAVQYVADKTKQILNTNPDMNFNQAYQQAYQDAQALWTPQVHHMLMPNEPAQFNLPTGPAAPAPAVAHPNVTQSEYDALKPGDTYWYDGKEYTKK